MPNPNTVIIGYALPTKKEPTFIQPSLLSYATEHGVVLRRIDSNQTLIDQGTFDCIVHKIYDQNWIQNLQQFSSQNPDVPIIDPPQSIERLHNRVSMLDVVTRLKLSVSKPKLLIPNQIFVFDAETLKTSEFVRELKFPVIAKPIEANGTAKSHQMHLVFDDEGLMNLTPPVVLQEFVNHGGVVFKVYVAGEHVKCVKRRSLPDISEERLRKLKGSLPFSQISNLAEKEEEEQQKEGERAELPDSAFVEEVARGLREEMGLSLFNFDMIRDVNDGDRYVVIDINYFPGYAKMPDYERVLTQFFLDVVKKNKKDSTTNNNGIAH